MIFFMLAASILNSEDKRENEVLVFRFRFESLHSIDMNYILCGDNEDALNARFLVVNKIIRTLI